MLDRGLSHNTIQEELEEEPLTFKGHEGMNIVAHSTFEE